MPAHHATPEARDARVIVTSPALMPDGTRKVAVLIDGAEASILSPRFLRMDEAIRVVPCADGWALAEGQHKAALRRASKALGLRAA